MIANALEDKPLRVYGDGLQVRDWIYVEDRCRAIDQAPRKGRLGEIYNVGGTTHRTNLDVIGGILKLLGKPESLITHVEDRLGTTGDTPLDSAKIRREPAWLPVCSFEKGLEQTVNLYRTHPDWLERCRSGAYRDYYRRHYEERAKRVGIERARPPARRIVY